MNASSWTRSAQEFCALRDVWEAAESEAPWRWDWRWVALEARHPLSCAVDGYLVLDRHFRPSACAPRERAAPETTWCDEACDVADEAAAPRRDGFAIEWEYHVLFSPTYGTPELRLRATWHDGRPLSLDEVKRELSSSQDVISREAHPVTNEPFVLFHACCEPERAGALGGDASLLAWFATVAPTVGLRIPPERWRALRAREEGRAS